MLYSVFGCWNDHNDRFIKKEERKRNNPARRIIRSNSSKDWKYGKGTNKGIIIRSLKF